ncbi:hypothetical protein [Microlunatus flavus]|uniref:PASTA domain-containing protein n=1 Tax=Microlunatus flavus TaxID=1036181 RepID=A0A1H9FQY8_9ACTN|nr:hypothetical protein [Microlunatus flavus]SEQ40325.1 hypothetical protein SAMN05421756_103352 [Microlunatus flavus]
MAIQQIPVPYRTGYDVGLGADLLSGSPMATAVTGAVTGVDRAQGATVNFTVSRIHTTSDLEQSLGIDVDASYGCAAFGAGVSNRFSFAQSSKVQSSSLFMTVTVTVELEFLQIDVPTLTSDAAALVDRPDLFESRYGNVFVRGLQRGGMFVGVLRVDTRSSEDTEHISDDLQGSYGLFSAEAKLNFNSVLKKYQSEVFVQMYHEGGPTDLKITDPTDPLQLLDNANAFLQSFTTSPDAVAKPYYVTLAPIGIALGPPPLNAVDIQHAQDVLMYCAHRRSTLLDDLNLMEFIGDHTSRYDFPAGVTPADIRAAGAGFQADLDLIAQAASAAVNSPADATMPAEYAKARGIVYPQGVLPTVMPVPKPVAADDLVPVPQWDTVDYVQNGGTITTGAGNVYVPSASQAGFTVRYVYADCPGSREPGDMTGVVGDVQPNPAPPGSTLTVTVWN